MAALIARSLRQWWTQSNAQALHEAQDKLLRAFVKADFCRHEERTAGLNSVEFVKKDGGVIGANETLVLAHGFGSGLGFFYNNVDPLLQSCKVRRVILVDWLGMGGSDRPYCSQPRPIRGLTDLTTSWCDSRFSPSQAVNFFIQPFQQWMEQVVMAGRTNEKIVLVAHSLGGYLAARFVLANPSLIPIEKLVLASPVGFPVKPANVMRGSQLPTSLRVVDALWSSNITPQQLVRLFGATRGRRNVQRALLARMPHLQQDGDSVKLLADYLYHITVADPSGEFAMNSLLEPAMSPEVMGVYAREPLQELFGRFNNGNDSCIRSIKVLFGEHDWMRTNEASARDTLATLSSASIQTSIEIVPSAGHHLYMDNSPDFVRHILN